MPMQLPGVITKIIGALVHSQKSRTSVATTEVPTSKLWSYAGTDVIPVEEVQQVERDGDGTVHITSIPHIGVPGGNKFQAVSKISVSNSGRGCKVGHPDNHVTLSMQQPWQHMF